MLQEFSGPLFFKWNEVGWKREKAAKWNRDGQVFSLLLPYFSGFMKLEYQKTEHIFMCIIFNSFDWCPYKDNCLIQRNTLLPWGWTECRPNKQTTVSKSRPRPATQKKLKSNGSTRPSGANTQKGVLFIIGDWNAKVGSQETPGVTSKFGLGVQTEAGQRLIEFCQENSLVIANSLFQQHKRWLYT